MKTSHTDGFSEILSLSENGLMLLSCDESMFWSTVREGRLAGIREVDTESLKHHVLWEEHFHRVQPEVWDFIKSRTDEEIEKNDEIPSGVREYVQNIRENQAWSNLVRVWGFWKNNDVEVKPVPDTGELDMVHDIDVPLRDVDESLEQLLSLLRSRVYHAGMWERPEGFVMGLGTEPHMVVSPEELVVMECAKNGFTVDKFWKLAQGFDIVDMDNTLVWLIGQGVVTVTEFDPGPRMDPLDMEWFFPKQSEKLAIFEDLVHVFTIVSGKYAFADGVRFELEGLLAENLILESVVVNISEEISEKIVEYHRLMESFEDSRTGVLINNLLDDEEDPEEMDRESVASPEMENIGAAADAVFEKIVGLEESRYQKNQRRRDILIEFMAKLPCDEDPDVILLQDRVGDKVREIDATVDYAFVPPVLGDPVVDDVLLEEPLLGEESDLVDETPLVLDGPADVEENSSTRSEAEKEYPLDEKNW